MRENTTGPVRGERTESRPGGSPAPAFSDPVVPGGRGEQRRVDDAAARREPLTEPVPVPSGTPKKGASQQSASQQSGAQQSGVALPKQNEGRKDEPGRRADDAATRSGSGSATQSGGPAPAPVKDTDTVPVAKPTGKTDTDQPAKPADQLDGTPMPKGADDHATTSARPSADKGDDTAVLFGDDAASTFRTRWRELQADFVDDPAKAVHGADKLVDEVLESLTQTLAKHKQGLAGGWKDGGETEELRQALRKYRSFLDQLLKT
jgi:hypothetical protein